MMRPARWLAVLLLLSGAGCAHRPHAISAGGASGNGSSAPATRHVSAPPAAKEASEDPDGDSAALDGFEETAIAANHEIADPLAPWNRAIFEFNDRFYFWLLKPVSRGYRAVVPRPARTSVRNFFHNLATPGRLLSNILQLKGREAAIELGVFMINSTWGVLGFGDWFASHPEADIPEEDLGQVLGRYGVGQGIYIVWPFYGPYTLRDSAALAGDLFLDPVSHIRPWPAAYGVKGYRMMNQTSLSLGDYETLKDAAIDPYLAFRDAYIQYRDQAVRE